MILWNFVLLQESKDQERLWIMIPSKKREKFAEIGLINVGRIIHQWFFNDTFSLFLVLRI